MVHSGQSSSNACKCLNVRIHQLPPPSPPTEQTSDRTFLLIYVGDEGIEVVHTQLTLRSKGPRSEHKQGESIQPFRYVSLTCLICQTLVYRVAQINTPDVEGGEGPVIPSDEWAESDVLKSASGWIELSKDLLDEQAIQVAQASPLHSNTFRVVLPATRPSGTSNVPELASLTPPATPPPSDTTHTILPALPALFPPPPFTSGHPVFSHLSSIASAESEKLRTSAEEYLKKVVAEKVAELDTAEAKLKKDVEDLWMNFRGIIDIISGKGASEQKQPATRKRSSSKSGTGHVLNGMAASVRVNDFVPVQGPRQRISSPPFANPVVSALSASLATSSFHHAMARLEEQGSSSRSPVHSTGTSSPTRAISPSTASSRTLGMPINGEAEIREAYRRNMNESLDIATSFKYMVDIGAHMAAAHTEPRAEIPEQVESPEPPSPSTSALPRGRSPRAGKSAFKKPKTDGESVSSKGKGSPAQTGRERSLPKDGPTPKGKRKVTFDVQPDVAIITNEAPVEDTPRPLGSEEAVFDMDNELIGDSTEAAVPVSSPQPTATAEPVYTGRRLSRVRPTSMSGLPSSFSTLRPASLPLPSALRARMSSETVDDRSRAHNIRGSVLSTIEEGDSKRRGMDEVLNFEQEQVTDPREAEILKLVAASTPSHRSAWKKNSAAWQTFVNRQKALDNQRNSIPEEDESSNAEGSAYYDESEDDSGLEDENKDQWSNNDTIARSLPIPIGPLGANGKTFGLPSFQPKTSLSDRPGILVPPLDKVSAAAMRRASYAERDRHRSVDPGALDFTAEDDDDADEDEDMEMDQEVGSKSRQRALKILQKRSEIPPDNMWRSLA
ncbi:hypothetical protein PHLCEN_2v9373 [Hermanssonia centrifuga]|uniref:Uncharacterized protein n=1 Tax=Hermanssonia centrifuga TaxID=98765 RepID=A0A2R6NR32_9APHY|nr:hypothetical protein PHLCEN_2v9373 [Hermanssonia centrifuga]